MPLHTISCSTILYATLLYDLQRYYSDNVAIKIEMQQCYSDNAAKCVHILCLPARRIGRERDGRPGAGAEIMTNGHASLSKIFKIASALTKSFSDFNILPLSMTCHIAIRSRFRSGATTARMPVLAHTYKKSGDMSFL